MKESKVAGGSERQSPLSVGRNAPVDVGPDRNTEGARPGDLTDVSTKIFSPRKIIRTLNAAVLDDDDLQFGEPSMKPI